MTICYKLGLTAGLLSVVLFSAACGGHRDVVYVRTPPPPPVVEGAVVSPGPGFFWVPGYQVWSGNAYTWRPGRWERIPAGRREWVPGTWVQERGGWRWREGRWR